MDIGTIIKIRRQELGLTLEDIGKATDVSKSTVKKWENGFIENMKRDKIADLAKVLKLSPLSFIKGEIIYENEDQYNAYLKRHEKKVIKAYREQRDMQTAVDRLLGIED